MVVSCMHSDIVFTADMMTKVMFFATHTIASHTKPTEGCGNDWLPSTTQLRVMSTSSPVPSSPAASSPLASSPSVSSPAPPLLVLRVDLPL